MDKILLGKRIKEARALRRVTLDEVANAICLNKSTLSRYERGEIETPKLLVIEAIADCLRVNPSWLVGKSDDMTYTPRNTDFFVSSPCDLFAPLKQMREKRGLSANSVALKIGISEADYRRIEAGGNTDCKTLSRIAEFFCCSTDYVLSFDGVFGEDECSRSEWNLVQKFRQLDDRGKSAVLNVLDHEYNSLPGEEANPSTKEA